MDYKKCKMCKKDDCEYLFVIYTIKFINNKCMIKKEICKKDRIIEILNKFDMDLYLFTKKEEYRIDLDNGFIIMQHFNILSGRKITTNKIFVHFNKWVNNKILYGRWNEFGNGIKIAQISKNYVEAEYKVAEYRRALYYALYSNNV